MWNNFLVASRLKCISHATFVYWSQALLDTFEGKEKWSDAVLFSTCTLSIQDILSLLSTRLIFISHKTVIFRLFLVFVLRVYPLMDYQTDFFHNQLAGRREKCFYLLFWFGVGGEFWVWTNGITCRLDIGMVCWRWVSSSVVERDSFVSWYSLMLMNRESKRVNSSDGVLSRKE